ncbi:hypothetical protein D9615_009357 [Tricholomella constricta]|uniref:FAD-binding FR-type domain-containing protein n=1 Tax=Tricholomella constricta TaxID=117010 RepID=A0A8H5LZW5_9AGAR|nr:hypothetical protein D9615_009357 [Tricholomella constricta]
MASPISDSLSNFVPDKVIAITKASQTPDPDRKLRIAQAVNYPNRAWFCVAAFIGLVSICHFLTLFYRTTRRRRSPRTATPRGVASLSRLPSALMNTFRAFAFRTTIPIGGSYTLNVAEVFLTAAYTTIIFVWSLVNATSTKGVKYDPKYWGNMAGNVASAQLPLMTALGTKNNIISFLTGVSFDKLNYLHRMSARAICVLLWVHAAGRIKVGMVGSFSWAHPWIQAGLLGSTSFSLLCIMAIRPLRDRNYEIFLIIHFLMAFITLLAGYFHAQGILVGYYVWPAFVVWALDRAIRMIRIIVHNAGFFQKRSTQQLGRVDVLSPHFIRIAVPRPAHLHWLPGQSAYLTIPGASKSPFEAHPFTISTIDVPGTGPDDAEKDEGSRRSLPELAFLVRVRSGFTKRLLNVAVKDQLMKVIVDGPYSSPPLLRGFETVVLVAGGSGVAFTLPLLLDLIHRARLDESDCTRVVFVWAIRDPRHIEWIADALIPAIAGAQDKISIDIRVYVTGVAEDDAQSWDDDTNEGDEEVKAGDGSSSAKRLNYPGVAIEEGRPDLKCLVEDEIVQSSGAISFNVCGTHALAHAVQSALKPPRFLDVLRGGPAVILHIESFGSG